MTVLGAFVLGACTAGLVGLFLIFVGAALWRIVEECGAVPAVCIVLWLVAGGVLGVVLNMPAPR